MRTVILTLVLSLGLGSSSASFAQTKKPIYRQRTRLLLLNMERFWKLPSGLLMAICTVESGLNSSALNSQDKGESLGLCQIKLATAQWLGFKGTREDLLQSPRRNAYWAGKYLRYQLDRYSDAMQAVCAYNLGHFASFSGECVNSDYWHKVQRVWNEYRSLNPEAAG